MSGNYVEIVIDKKPVRALVDSGASYSVMSENFCQKLRKVVFPNTKNLVLKVANGRYVQPKGRCSARMTINGRTQSFEFLVLPDCSHEVILGWDFLQSSQAIIDCSRNELLLEDVTEDDFLKSDPVQTLQLRAITDYHLPPKSISKIAVIGPDLQGAFDIAVEGNKSLLISHEICIPSTITTYTGISADLWVTNAQSTPKIIPKGMCVAYAEILDDRFVNVLEDPSPSKSATNRTEASECNYSLMLDNNLTEKQKSDLVNILRRFKSIFHTESGSCSNRPNVKHRINTGDHPPINQRAYRVSPAERRAIQEEVEKMLKKDIIQPSESPWSSPVVLVKKKDGSWRFCVDYRRLNKITKKDVYPLPRIDDILDCLKGANYFSSMDLYSGYWQIEVDEADREKTAFITPEGLYEFKVMPFGLCNAPATFERMMDNLLRHLKWTICLCYLDDIVVFSKTFEDHIRRLSAVLACIERAGLILNPKKCLFGAQQIKILGHLVSSEGVCPDPEKIKAVTHFPVPKNLRDVKSFLGLCSYYRRFIKGFCFKAQPLQKLLKGEAKFHWNDEQEDAFNKLKSELASEPILALYDENAPTELHTDASGYGLGAVLVQIQEGNERVIAYASRTLTKAERNYSTTERECLAVVWAISKFRPYLFGKPFTVVTDHHSLCWLTGLKDPSGRLARWALRLQEYDVTIAYKSGRKHKDADCLSRNPVENPEEKLGSVLAISSSKDVITQQKNDPDIRKLLRSIENSTSLQHDYQEIDGILCKRNYDPSGKQWLPVIPRSMRLDILQSFHDEPTAGHLGFAKTYDRLRKRFYWPGLYRSVRRYVLHCRECQRRKSIPQKPTARLVSIPPATTPFHRVGIDLLGRFPKSAHGNKWIIVCTDYLTRYAVTKALPTAEASEVAKFLVEDIILKHGAPRILITDRGQVFQSKLVTEIIRLCNVTHRMTTAYHPQTNGLTERLNKTLADMLSMYVDVEQKNWDEFLPFVTFAYNTAKQDTTGFTPFFLLHGREAETTVDTLFPYSSSHGDDAYIEDLIAKAEESRQLARLRTFDAQEKDRRRYDSRHRMVSYHPGDLVWVYTPVRKVGISEKLLKRYFGPYKVIRKLSDVTYEVEDCEPTPGRRKIKDTVHLLRMKPYYDPDAQEEEIGNDEPIVENNNKTSTGVIERRMYAGPVTRARAKEALTT